MANYGYIYVRVGPKESSAQERAHIFTPLLVKCVREVLDDRWKVDLTDYEDNGPVWFVCLPGTATPYDGVHACTENGCAFDEDIGFPVALQSDCIAFRHQLSLFTTWAQGRVEEQLSEHYRCGITYDATGRTTPIGPKSYRMGKTFFDYLSHGLPKPLSSDDRAYIERYKRGIPEGHWGE